MLISLSWGRTQQWFDKLSPVQQKEYLEAHPHSKFKKVAPLSKEHVRIKSRIAALRKALVSEQDHLEHLRKKPKSNIDEIARVGKNIIRLREKIKEYRNRLKGAAQAPAPVTQKTTKTSTKTSKTHTAKTPKLTTSKEPKVARPKTKSSPPTPAHHITKRLHSDERESVEDALKDAGINPKTATVDHVESVANKQLKHWQKKESKAATPADKFHSKSLHKHWGRIVEKIKQILKR